MQKQCSAMQCKPMQRNVVRYIPLRINARQCNKTQHDANPTPCNALRYKATQRNEDAMRYTVMHSNAAH
eukprot:3549914-Pyramimonas_sp.AAC.1